MIEALRSKDLKKAKTGAYLSFLAFVLAVVSIISQALYISQYSTAVSSQYMMWMSPCIVYFIFVVIMPAVKIRDHLERREALFMASHIA